MTTAAGKVTYIIDPDPGGREADAIADALAHVLVSARDRRRQRQQADGNGEQQAVGQEHHGHE